MKFFSKSITFIIAIINKYIFAFDKIKSKLFMNNV